MNIPDQPIAMSHQIHTSTELLQQIHDDLRIQHPEWVEPNGESLICDSYESRLMKLLDLEPFFAGKHERRPPFTTNEGVQNAMFGSAAARRSGASQGHPYPN